MFDFDLLMDSPGFSYKTSLLAVNADDRDSSSATVTVTVKTPPLPDG